MTNKTALVTGASDGIGLEFCKILAAKGYDLILVARRKDKLNEVAKSLTDRHASINCTVITADLSKPQAAQKLFQATTARRGAERGWCTRRLLIRVRCTCAIYCTLLVCVVCAHAG